jgi:hypothetical protein
MLVFCLRTTSSGRVMLEKLDLRRSKEGRGEKEEEKKKLGSRS